MFCSQNCTITFIANIIGRNKSTISRELKRNAVDSKYSAVAAQAAYEQRQRNCHPKKKLADLVVFGKVREKFLEHQWFPEQISQRLKLEKANFSISYSTIYRGIYAGMFDTKKERDSTGNRGAMRISGIEVKLVTPKITLKNEVKLLLATIYPSPLCGYGTQPSWRLGSRYCCREKERCLPCYSCRPQKQISSQQEI